MKNNQQGDFFRLFDLLGSADKNAKQQAANQMMSGLNSDESKQLGDILSDKSKIDAILSSPAAKQILNKINGNANGQHK